jgi:hypothetical protein
MPPRKCKIGDKAAETERRQDSLPSPPTSDTANASSLRPTPLASTPFAALLGQISGDVLPCGFPADYNMCYRNATLSLLMDIAPVVRYLGNFSDRAGQTSDHIFTELCEAAIAYWTPESDQERRIKVDAVLDKLWAHLLYLHYDGHSETAGWGPFLDHEQQETQQDAADFLGNLLQNGDAQCRHQG